MARSVEQSTSAATLGKDSTWMGDPESGLVTWNSELHVPDLRRVETAEMKLKFQVVSLKKLETIKMALDFQAVSLDSVGEKGHGASFPGHESRLSVGTRESRRRGALPNRLS